VMAVCLCALLTSVLVFSSPVQVEQYPGGEVLTDPVAQLQRKLERGDAALSFSPGRGYLPSVLRELAIPVSSQSLVFSKTSLQIDHISVSTPRAVYFNDDSYVAWIPDAPMIEIASTDPRYGAVFYTLAQDQSMTPSFQRLQQPCMSCHGPVRPEIPAPLLLMMSVDTDVTGEIVNDFFLTTDRSALEERWGGWYVSGSTGAMQHRGRSIPADTSRYLASHSDVVALMLLAHQADVHNRIAELAQEFRTGGVQSGWQEAVEPLVRTLLFSGEAALAAPIQGSSPLASEFSTKGPRDSKGRSLRDLDLQGRLFRYPLSYLIYSESFAQLPVEAKERVFARLLDVLRSTDNSEPFRHLSTADRTATLEILTATLPDFSKWVAAR